MVRMRMAGKALRPAKPWRGGQRGAYALEFGLVFGFIVALIYTTIVLGILFTAKQMMTWAAEDGARAALRHAPSVSERLDEAARVARWRAQPFVACVAASAVSASACGVVSDTEGACVQVVVRAAAPVPLVPGLSLLVPDEVLGSARVFLDGIPAPAMPGGECA